MIDRRTWIKGSAASTLTTWIRPVVSVVSLPVHAQTSANCTPIQASGRWFLTLGDSIIVLILNADGTGEQDAFVRRSIEWTISDSSFVIVLKADGIPGRVDEIYSGIINADCATCSGVSDTGEAYTGRKA